MCSQDNTAFFRTYNILFFIVHVAFLIAGIITYADVHDTWRPYYRIIVTHGQELEVYPLFISLGMHLTGALFHLYFSCRARHIVETSFGYGNTNPSRWFLQFFGEGAGLLGIMVIHGIHHLETLGVVILIYAAVLALCYFQDEYLNPNYEFMPGKEPHMFAVPLYAFLIVFVTIKSTEHINGKFSARVSIVSLISLFQTSLMFIVQRMHIYNSSSSSSSGTRIETAVEDNTEGGTEDVDTKIDELENDMAELRRGIFYEILQYTNSTIFMMVVSWLIISIVRNDVVLHDDIVDNIQIINP